MKKLFVPSLLLGLCLALAAPLPAQARTQVRKAAVQKQAVVKQGAQKAGKANAAVLKAAPHKALAQRSGVGQRSAGRKLSPMALRGSKSPLLHSKRVVQSRPLRAVALVAEAPARSSFGQLQGLHGAGDALALKSSVALVIDQDTNEVLFAKNPGAVLPIASITKLMTGLVVSDSRQPLDEMLLVTQDDIDTEKGSRSRLSVGTQLTRGEMLHLALMSSENRAANALGRHYPGGLPAFVAAMNRKASALGMRDTHYAEPTGLSSQNQSSAQDLAVLVRAAHGVPLLRELSTSHEAQVAVGHRMMQFHNTNRLVLNPDWDIGLQKTGYIAEAGRCVVMQAQLAGRKLIMVLLDSTGKYSRLGDAERIRRWLADSLPVRTVRPTS